MTPRYPCDDLLLGTSAHLADIQISKRDAAHSFVKSALISPLPRPTYYFPEHLNLPDFFEVRGTRLLDKSNSQLWCSNQALCRIAACEYPKKPIHEAVQDTVGQMVANLDAKYGDGDGTFNSSELMSLRSKYL